MPGSYVVTCFWIALLRSLHSLPPFPAYIAPWTGDRCAVPSLKWLALYSALF